MNIAWLELSSALGSPELMKGLDNSQQVSLQRRWSIEAITPGLFDCLVESALRFLYHKPPDPVFRTKDRAGKANPHAAWRGGVDCLGDKHAGDEVQFDEMNKRTPVPCRHSNSSTTVWIETIVDPHNNSRPRDQFQQRVAVPTHTGSHRSEQIPARARSGSSPVPLWAVTPPNLLSETPRLRSALASSAPRRDRCQSIRPVRRSGRALEAIQRDRSPLRAKEPDEVSSTPQSKLRSGRHK